MLEGHLALGSGHHHLRVGLVDACIESVVQYLHWRWSSHSGAVAVVLVLTGKLLEHCSVHLPLHRGLDVVEEYVSGLHLLLQLLGIALEAARCNSDLKI